MKPSLLSVGVLSEGTHNTDELIDAILPEVERLHLGPDGRKAVRRLRRRFDDLMTEPEHIDAVRTEAYLDEELGHLYDDLCQICEEVTPSYCHFGPIEGDGACIGVWPDTDLLSGNDDGDVWRSDDSPSTEAPKARESRYWLHVNDHGNATLYARVGPTWGRYRELWSVV